MKDMIWPGKVVVPINKKLGGLLDFHCATRRQTRPAALLAGLELLLGVHAAPAQRQRRGNNNRRRMV